MINKIKQFWERFKKWLIAFLVPVAMASISSDQILISQLPKNELLITSKEMLLDYVENDSVIIYSYNSKIEIKDSYGEEVDKRTNNSKTFKFLEQEYIVQEGDTLSEIAKSYGLSNFHLDNNNEIKNLDLICAGDIIKVPEYFKSEFIAGSPQYYEDSNGYWYQIETATTTKNAFDLQTKPNIIDNIFSFFDSKVLATSPEIYYTSAGDGVVYVSGGASWDAAHDATSGTADYGSTGGNAVYVYWQTGGYTDLYRGFFPINTAALPDTADISATTLQVYVTAIYDQDNDANGFVAIVLGSQASVSSLTGADFNNVGSVIGSDEVDLTNMTDDAYNTWTLNSTARENWIIVDGYTKLAMREGHDLNDEHNTDHTSNLIRIRWANYAGTSSDPKLTVTYTVPVSRRFIIIE